ncbi:hypothetical protein PAMP_024619 [Pampus punctatissimus]
MKQEGTRDLGHLDNMRLHNLLFTPLDFVLQNKIRPHVTTCQELQRESEIQGQRCISHIFCEHPRFHPIQITHVISSLLSPPTYRRQCADVYAAHTPYVSSGCLNCYMRYSLKFIGAFAPPTSHRPVTA